MIRYSNIVVLNIFIIVLDLFDYIILENNNFPDLFILSLLFRTKHKIISMNLGE